MGWGWVGRPAGEANLREGRSYRGGGIGSNTVWLLFEKDGPSPSGGVSINLGRSATDRADCHTPHEESIHVVLHPPRDAEGRPGRRWRAGHGSAERLGPGPEGLHVAETALPHGRPGAVH